MSPSTKPLLHRLQNPLVFFSDCNTMPNIYFISPKLNLQLKPCTNTSEEILRFYPEEEEGLTEMNIVQINLCLDHQSYKLLLCPKASTLK